MDEEKMSVVITIVPAQGQAAAMVADLTQSDLDCIVGVIQSFITRGQKNDNRSNDASMGEVPTEPTGSQTETEQV